MNIAQLPSPTSAIFDEVRNYRQRPTAWQKFNMGIVVAVSAAVRFPLSQTCLSFSSKHPALGIVLFGGDLIVNTTENVFAFYQVTKLTKRLYKQHRTTKNKILEATKIIFSNIAGFISQTPFAYLTYKESPIAPFYISVNFANSLSYMYGMMLVFNQLDEKIRYCRDYDRQLLECRDRLIKNIQNFIKIIPSLDRENPLLDTANLNEAKFIQIFQEIEKAQVPNPKKSRWARLLGTVTATAHSILSSAMGFILTKKAASDFVSEKYQYLLGSVRVGLGYVTEYGDIDEITRVARRSFEYTVASSLRPKTHFCLVLLAYAITGMSWGVNAHSAEYVQDYLHDRGWYSPILNYGTPILGAIAQLPTMNRLAEELTLQLCQYLDGPVFQAKIELDHLLHLLLKSLNTSAIKELEILFDLLPREITQLPEDAYTHLKAKMASYKEESQPPNPLAEPLLAGESPIMDPPEEKD